MVFTTNNIFDKMSNNEIFLVSDKDKRYGLCAECQRDIRKSEKPCTMKIFGDYGIMQIA